MRGGGGGFGLFLKTRETGGLAGDEVAGAVGALVEEFDEVREGGLGVVLEVGEEERCELFLGRI